MATYVSKHAAYCIVVQTEKVVPALTARGETRMLPTQPHLDAQFAIKPMPYELRKQALAVFAANPHAFGSEPVATDGQAVYADIAGESYEGEPVELRFSTFDTAWVPAAHADLYERQLDTHPEFGKHFFKLDPERAEKPFPAYDEITGAGADKKLGRICRELGADPADWASYERENQNRLSVLAEFSALAEERERARAEIETLSGKV